MEPNAFGFIEPEIFTEYIDSYIYDNSAFFQGGVITEDANLNQLVSGGGSTIHIPFWRTLGTEDSEPMSFTDPIRTDSIEAKADIAPLIIRAQGWTEHQLKGALAGSDPMAAIGRQIGEWWIQDEQKILLSVLNGMFDSPSMEDLLLDAPTRAIDYSLVVDGQARLGDAFQNLGAIAMHSGAFFSLKKQGQISLVPSISGNIGPREAVEFPTYDGLTVIVSDVLPRQGNTYVSYLFGAGAVARGTGTPTSIVPVSMDRDEPMSTDRLWHRRALVLHPTGVAWTGAGNTLKPTPSNAELQDGNNWNRVYEPKQIGVVKMVHTIG